MSTSDFSAGASIRVMIVDDHPLMRTGLTAVLHSRERFDIVAEAINGLEAVERYRRLQPDITLMDIQMPTMDGVEATRAICSEFKNAKIIVFTTYRGDAQVLEALNAGAKAYLLKSAIDTELLDAIEAVHKGRRFVTPEIGRELAEHLGDETLSPRELQVLASIAAGNSNKRIGAQLGVAEETVKNHVKSVLSKLGANDRTHAVSIAYRRGILRPE